MRRWLLLHVLLILHTGSSLTPGIHLELRGLISSRRLPPQGNVFSSNGSNATIAYPRSNDTGAHLASNRTTLSANRTMTHSSNSSTDGSAAGNVSANTAIDQADVSKVNASGKSASNTSSRVISTGNATANLTTNTSANKSASLSANTTTNSVANSTASLPANTSANKTANLSANTTTNIVENTTVYSSSNTGTNASVNTSLNTTVTGIVNGTASTAYLQVNASANATVNRTTGTAAYVNGTNQPPFIGPAMSACMGKSGEMLCSGHGECDSEICMCNSDYHGIHCEQAWCPGACSGHGVCDRATSYCRCETRYYGEACSVKVPHRCPGECSGHGQCNNATGVCSCEEGYDGLDCGVSKARSCPMVNGYECAAQGICDILNGWCVCADGFSGDDCAYGCLKDCNGHGHCHASTGRCDCFLSEAGQALYRGLACQHEVSPCDAMDCGAHGECSEMQHDGTTVATCECDHGYQGKKCTEVIEHSAGKQDKIDSSSSHKTDNKEDASIKVPFPSCNPTTNRSLFCQGNYAQTKLSLWMTSSALVVAVLIAAFIGCKFYHKYRSGHGSASYAHLDSNANDGLGPADSIQDDFAGL